jgi:hypothetical protein
MEIITLNDLSKAISNRVGIDKIKAIKVASFILDIFGYDDRIIDNVLEPEGRQLFYFLETEGILTTGREVTLLYNGREWLTHYWKLNKNLILKYANGHKLNTRKLSYKKEIDAAKGKNVYSSLSEEVWTSRKTNSAETIIS